MTKLPPIMDYREAEKHVISPKNKEWFAQGANWMRAEVQRLNAAAQPVSDDKSSLLTYLKECSEQVSRWPEWKKKGSDVAKLIKEMDDFDLGFVNGWTERHMQPVSDGWVKCSERMPVQHQSNRYVPLNLLLNERTVVQGGFDDSEFWMEGVVIKNVTRWMPLPAAPGGQDD